jgi:hypothetical protein
MNAHVSPIGLSFVLLLAALPAFAAESAHTPAPADARVYLIEPVDGAVVAPTFTVKFGLKGMGVAPAGVDVPGTGHHHLLIDAVALPAMAQPLPVNEQVRHFGKGQTETQLTLPPGPHTLQLLLGDKNHLPLAPPLLSEKITITVK